MHSAFHFSPALGRFTPVEMAARGGSNVVQVPRTAALAELRKIGPVIFMSVSTHTGDAVLTPQQAVVLQREFRATIGIGRASGVYTGKVLTLYMSSDDGRTFHIVQDGRTFFEGRTPGGAHGMFDTHLMVVLRSANGTWSFKHLDPGLQRLVDMVVDQRITDSLGVLRDPTELYITPPFGVEDSQKNLISTFDSNAALMVKLTNDESFGLALTHTGEHRVRGHVLFGADSSGSHLFAAGLSFNDGVPVANIGQVAKAQVIKQITDNIVAANQRLNRHRAAGSSPAAASA